MSCIRQYHIKPDYTQYPYWWTISNDKRGKSDYQNAGKISVFAKCGKCEHCRQDTQYAWGWRLCSDLQYYVHKCGYKVGFITLTYNDNMLPRFPAAYPEVEGMPCFSKDDTDKLILYIRKTLFRDYGLKEILYFLASERGKRATRRPHYHLIIAWNPSTGVTAEIMHERIRHYWADALIVKTRVMGEVERPPLGFVTPRTPYGGERKRDNTKILPFEVSCDSAFLKSAFYTCKYITKDFYFMREIIDKVPKRYLKSPDFKNYLPHHRQSKSLGFHGIASLSDAEKITLLLRGKCLLGDDKLSMPPLYIQNKLLFSLKYIVQKPSKQYPDGKRLVYRECTKFYEQYFDLIQDAKESYYTTLFERMTDFQFWTKEGVAQDRAMEVASLVRDKLYVNDFGCTLAQAYLYYYGMKYDFCFTDKRLTFFNRFRRPAMTYSSILIRYDHWWNIQQFFASVFDFMKFSDESNNIRDEAADESREYFSHIVSAKVV